MLTPNGNVNIEDIEVGDTVIATDPDTGETTEKQVLNTFVNETDELAHVWVDGEEMICTPGHKFYAPEKGWTSAIDLKAGDILVLSNGEYVTVEKVQHEILEEPVKVYNFEVEDFHTYYVGTDVSVLVHNMGCGGNNNVSAENETYYFRGTTEGYEGNSSLQRIGVTPASTDPLVSTVFATEAEQYGSGVVHIATRNDLYGINISEGNVLSNLEKEVCVEVPPKVFASKSSLTISAQKSRNILSDMGYKLPDKIYDKQQLNNTLKQTSRLTDKEITEYIKRSKK